MRNTPLAATLLALGLVLGAAAPAWSAPKDSHTKTSSARMTTVGTITAVDAANRTVTVKNAEGEENTFAVDPKVRNLAGVKPGDRVHVDYRVAVAVSLRKGGDGKTSTSATDAAYQEHAGGKPAVTAGKETTIVSNVLSVDKEKSTVKLKGPDGHVADFQVRDQAALAEVKPGDQVVAVVTEALAVVVRPESKAEAKAAAASAAQ